MGVSSEATPLAPNSYLGFDQFVQAVSGHDLDAKRSAMLVAAPLVNGQIQTDYAK